jgi:hypothetical protein
VGEKLHEVRREKSVFVEEVQSYEAETIRAYDTIFVKSANNLICKVFRFAVILIKSSGEGLLNCQRIARMRK